MSNLQLAAIVVLLCVPACVPTQEPRDLVSGLNVERTLGPGDKHTYLITLQEGAAVIGEADQHGVDLVIDVLDPDGKLIYTVDSPNGTEGPEPIDLTAFRTGRYTLVIHTLDEKAKPGKYVMKIDRILTIEDNGQRLAEKTYPAALQALWRSYLSDPKAIDKFLESRKEKGPVIEEVKGDSKNMRVTYMFYGNDHTATVTVEGGPHGFTGGLPMKRFLHTPLFYASEMVPRDARYTYDFSVTEVWSLGPAGAIQLSNNLPSIRDPLNQDVFDGRSVVSMPAAPPQPYIAESQSVPHGKLTPAALQSVLLKENRTLTVYTPSGYENAKSASDLLIMLDGEEYDGGGSVPMPTILDNLISANKIPSIVAVFVKNTGHRITDLRGSVEFANFVGNELVPWVRKNYHINLGPDHVVVAGASLGGLGASYCAFTHPEAIGNALSLSGSYWLTNDWRQDEHHPFPLTLAGDTGDFLVQLRNSERLPLRFYVAVGRFESSSAMLGTNREFRDILLLKGYPVGYKEIEGEHDNVWWRESLADGLLSLMGSQVK
jgi:enterochelin esterase family protein